ncbi:hypothetical protein H4R18_005938, partial [Coemansia javaensis]
EQLLSACMTNHSELVRELLAGPQPVDVNHTNALGFTALHYAAQTGSADCVELLAQVPGIKPNLQDHMGLNTPLHLVLLDCSDPDLTLRIVRDLTKAGSDPRVANKTGQCPKDLPYDDDEEIQQVLLRATLFIEKMESQARYNKNNNSNSNSNNNNNDDDDEDDGYSSG